MDRWAGRQAPAHPCKRAPGRAMYLRACIRYIHAQVLAEEMVGRLRSAESMKLALLQREQGEVARDLDAIQRLLADVTSASAAGPIDFLNAYTPLSDACSRWVAAALSLRCGIGFLLACQPAHSKHADRPGAGMMCLPFCVQYTLPI